MVNIVHCADFHLDCAFSGMQDSELKKQDLRDTFEAVCQYAVTSNANIALICGDFFDNESVTNKTQQFLFSAMARASSVRFFIIPGNHDYYSASSIYALSPFPQNVHIFKSGGIERIEIPELNADIYGVACTSPNSESRLLKGFKVKDNDKINIMLFHGNLVPQSASDNYYPFSAEEIKETGLDYLALGHIHAFSGINKAGNTYYAYPGCPEGRGFDETGAKGIISGTVGKSRHNLSFMPVCKRRYEIINVDITGINDDIALKEKLSEALSGLKDSAVRVILTGNISADFFIDTRLLKNNFNDMYYLEIENSTSILQDMQILRGERTLKGLFVNNILTDLEKDAEDAEIMQKALIYGLSALSGEGVKSLDN